MQTHFIRKKRSIIYMQVYLIKFVGKVVTGIKTEFIKKIRTLRIHFHVLEQWLEIEAGYKIYQ